MASSSNRRILQNLANVPMPENFTLLEEWKFNQGHPSLVVYKQGTRDEYVLLLDRIPETAAEYYSFAMEFTHLQAEEWAVRADEYEAQDLEQPNLTKKTGRVLEEKAWMLHDNHSVLTATLDALLGKTKDGNREFADFFHTKAAIYNYNCIHQSSAKDCEMHDHFDDLMLRCWNSFVKQYISINEEYFSDASRITGDTEQKNEDILARLTDLKKDDVTKLVQDFIKREAAIRKSRADHIRANEYAYAEEDVVEQLHAQQGFVINLLLDAAKAGYAPAVAELKKHFVKFTNKIGTMWLSEKTRDVEKFWNLASALSQSPVGSSDDGIGYYVESECLAKKFSEDLFDEVGRALDGAQNLAESKRVIEIYEPADPAQQLLDHLHQHPLCIPGSPPAILEGDELDASDTGSLNAHLSSLSLYGARRNSDSSKNPLSPSSSSLFLFSPPAASYSPASESKIGRYSVTDHEYTEEEKRARAAANYSPASTSVSKIGKFEVTDFLDLAAGEQEKLARLSLSTNSSPSSESKAERFAVTDVELTEEDKEAQAHWLAGYRPF